MLLPGPEAQQLATYMGWLMHGTKGGIVAGVLFVAPSLVILIALSWAYMAFGHVPWVTAILYGIKPVVLALVIHAAHRMGSKTLHTPWLAGLSLVSFGAMVMGLPFPLIVLTAALAGWCLGKFKPLALGASTQAKPVQDKWSGETEQAPIWLDDDTPPMPHTRFSWSGLGKVMLVGLALCAVPLLTLSATLGWQHAYSQMAWFFTKAALLTFGGAYAVLPYVAQGAITHYAWITPMQMMDGLALGESTPGPLIMVVTFVGFVGAYTHQLLGPNAPALAGIAAACLVTWFTFLPSFVLIFAGAPLIETTHGRMAFTGPLTAISCLQHSLAQRMGRQHRHLRNHHDRRVTLGFDSFESPRHSSNCGRRADGLAGAVGTAPAFPLGTYSSCTNSRNKHFRIGRKVIRP
jgi:chromate transporter